MPIPSQPSNIEMEFIKRILSNSSVNVDVTRLDSIDSSEDYDMYRIFTNNGALSLKFSYEYDNKHLLREIKNSKKLNTPNTPWLSKL